VSTGTTKSRAQAKAWWKNTPTEVVHTSRTGDIVHADALTALTNVADGCVDLAFLDPPFNLGKSYGADGKAADLLSDAEYLSYMSNIITEVIRTLKPGGALYLYHIPKWAMVFAGQLNSALSFRHWIAVSMKNGFVRGTGLYPAHYALLYFTKGPPAVANRPKIEPATCPHCDEYTKDYGGYASHIVNGVNLSDVWDDLSPVRHSKYKNRAANELPMKLTSRVMAISGKSGSVLLDPFAGTGTTVLAARNKKMKFIAIDRELSNCQLIAERIERVQTARKSKARTAQK
jgi:site-specific DNA-methyltransferase (adenine-specific)